MIWRGYWIGFDGQNQKWHVFQWTSDDPPGTNTGYLAWGGPYQKEEAAEYTQRFNRAER